MYVFKTFILSYIKWIFVFNKNQIWMSNRRCVLSKFIRNVMPHPIMYNAFVIL